MPVTSQCPLLRLAVALGVASSHVLGAAGAHADDAPPSPARCLAPEVLTVKVAPFPDEPARAEKVEHEINSELRSSTRAHCWTGRQTAGLRAQIDVNWPDASSARIVIVLATATQVHYGIRDVVLQKLPPDGIPLALAIASDELLTTVSEQASLDRLPAPPPTPRPVVVARHCTPAAARPATPRPAFGPAMAFDVVSTGVSLVGPDAQLFVPIANSFVLGLRAGARASPDGRRRAAPTTTGAWLAGGSLRIGPQGAQSGLAVSAGGDAMRLVLATARDSATETLFIGHVGLAAYTTITTRLRVTADVYVGGALGRADSALGSSDSSGRSGNSGRRLPGDKRSLLRAATRSLPVSRFATGRVPTSRPSKRAQRLRPCASRDPPWRHS